MPCTSWNANARIHDSDWLCGRFERAQHCFWRARSLRFAAMELFYEPKVTLLARPHFSEPEHLPVSWLGESTDGERLAEFAGRLCYMSQANPAKRPTREYLENIKKQGHGSVP